MKIFDNYAARYEKKREEEYSLQDQIDSLDVSITALIDMLVEKKLFTQKEFDDKVATYYEEETAEEE